MTPRSTVDVTAPNGGHSLTDHLAQLIRADGPLTVAQYMTAALTHPIYGYYRVQNPVGRAGDFITAPEISQIFGELIGLWCLQTWRDIGAPSSFQLVELGPGRGSLMADLLRAARLQPSFLAAAEIHFVETNAVLRAQQNAALPEGTDATWRDRFEEIAPGPLILIANEFFDCLPIRQFMRKGPGWYERCVTLDEKGALCFALSPSPIPGGILAISDPHTQQGALKEVCAPAQSLIEKIAHRFSQHKGRALIIDYGYAKPGMGDTLQALRRHSPCGVLETPGDVDLTAHVDFSALASCAKRSGADVAGPAEQGAFLAALGLEARASALRAEATAQQKQDIDSAVLRLAGPDQMGELFKALSISSADLPPPPGF